MAVLGIGNASRYRKLMQKARDRKTSAAAASDKARDYAARGKELEDSAKGFFASFKGAKREGAKANYAKADSHSAEAVKGFKQSRRNINRLKKYRSKVNTSRGLALAGAGAGTAAYSWGKKDR